ncbi:hypothetical protein SAY87_029694 [Trapa incisa]|uniref:Protein arginine methyltransferase NDUFAF7 n=1 Tax=Trapa incisa TaxID=236973 RepID=A0AAN7QDF3_9MYRT|nr:hypothetical protein SAY87_029694 [Trapa incisa]
MSNAVSLAGILNRTLVVLPVLDHHAVTLESCPKFRGSTIEQTEDETKDAACSTISIDHSGLYNPPEHPHGPSSFCGGPILVAEYMEEVLTNPKAGFYINRDVFGAHGDFITSPEVSQIVGVWALCPWEQMGQPKKKM